MQHFRTKFPARCPANDGLRFFHDLLRVCFTLAAFDIDLADALGTSRPCREPAVIRTDLDASDGSAVAWRVAQHAANRFTRQFRAGDLLGGQSRQPRLLFWRDESFHTFVGRIAEFDGQLAVDLAGVALQNRCDFSR